MTQKKADFQDLISEVTQEFPQFEKTVPGRQEFITMNANELFMYKALCAEFRKHKIISEGFAVAVAAAHFLRSIKEENDEASE